jgi:hypothetical protein
MRFIVVVVIIIIIIIIIIIKSVTDICASVHWPTDGTVGSSNFPPPPNFLSGGPRHSMSLSTLVT